MNIYVGVPRKVVSIIELRIRTVNSLRHFIYEILCFMLYTGFVTSIYFVYSCSLYLRVSVFVQLINYFLRNTHCINVVFLC